MNKIVLPVVLASALSLLLAGCDHHAEESKDCIAGKAQPAMDVAQAMSVLKAAGFEIRRPGDAPAVSPQTPGAAAQAPEASQAPEMSQAPQAAQTPTPVQPSPLIANSPAPARSSGQRRFSLVCNATVQGERVSQSLSVDLDADTVNGARADVSDTEIKWTTQVHDSSGAAFGGEVHTLNRLTGDYRFYDAAAVYSEQAPTWQCAPASARLF